MTNVLVTPTLNQTETERLTKLQNIVLPDLEICVVEKLFLRKNSRCVLNYEQNSVELEKGGTIRFDTYFNAFSAQKWKEYTKVKAITIKATLRGAFKVKLLQIDHLSEDTNLIHQTAVETDNLSEVCLFENVDFRSYKGLLYIEIQALEDNCLFTDGCFYGSAGSAQPSDKKIAIVMCTYRREAYVKRNTQLLEKHLLNKLETQEKFEIFIIDNGKTLKSFVNTKIHLVPNRNTGGSGGYTRGVLEVLNRKSEFSHIIFIDDDVVIAPEVFERIYNFQTVIADEKLCIGGSMLKLDRQYIQHENGAVWDDEIIRVKPDLDLRNVENVLFNEVEEYTTYNGWWLFCFPTQVVDDSSLPYPFFIRGDDIEFPMRLDLKIVTFNGICAWHESFESKCSPIPNYYSKKNEIILSLLYSKRFSRLSAVKKVAKFALREAFCYRYQGADLILKAASDLLKGPAHLTMIDPEKRNSELFGMVEKMAPKPELPFFYDKYQRSVNETESKLRRGLRLVLLNGHLLPSFLMHQDKSLSGNSYRIAPIQSYRPINNFRAKKVLYYHLATKESFVASFSRARFFQVLMRTILICLALFFKFSILKRSYLETLPELTNRDFWERYLEIDQQVHSSNNQ